jgi:hypothetical protein
MTNTPARQRRRKKKSPVEGKRTGTTSVEHVERTDDGRIPNWIRRQSEKAKARAAGKAAA